MIIGARAARGASLSSGHLSNIGGTGSNDETDILDDRRRLHGCVMIPLRDWVATCFESRRSND